jgi:hypothetical protein
MAEGQQLTQVESAPLPEIIQRYVAGESIQTIAEDHRVSRRTIYRWMLGAVGDKAYYDMVTQCLVARVSDADHELETAVDPCHIARARETARYARMDLERRRPALYGQKQQVDVQGSISVTIARGSVLEAPQHEVTDAEIISGE